MNDFSNIATADDIQSHINEIPEVEDQIALLADSTVGLLETIDEEMDTEKIKNIARTLVSQKEIVTRMISLYGDIYEIAKRLSVLMSREEFDEVNREVIKKRAMEIVEGQLFIIQQEVFFKIVNAKENAEGEKNEDGPAMFYPGVEKTKNTIVRHIQLQTDHLYPFAVDICKSFPGIAADYAATEGKKASDKSKYDTIAQVFEAEKNIRVQFIQDTSSERLRDEDFLGKIIEAFEGVFETYIEKRDSLNALDQSTVQNLDQKMAILRKGQEDIDKRVKPLRVLQNLAERFPQLVSQMDFFAESHYQARAVLTVLEEVSEEMDTVFTRYNLESFTVISFLKHKLNGMSHMYESIHYYFATKQIENDIRGALIKRFHSPKNQDWKEVVKTKIEQTEVPGHVSEIHKTIAVMNEYNYDIHLAFLDYKERKDIEKLREQLKLKTDQLNRLFDDVQARYSAIQDKFSTFLMEDLGATGIESQFNLRFKEASDQKEAQDIAKSFNMLLATKKGTIQLLEREFTKRFGEKLTRKQITAAAMVKVRKEFVKTLLKEIQIYPYAQQLFVEVLKLFISERDEEMTQQKAEDTVFWMIEKMSPGIIDRFRAEKSNLYKKILNKEETLSNRDLMIAFLADNLTPQEMENFSRILPGLPRNKMHLDTPYGRILLEISKVYQRQMAAKSGSVVHFMEKIFEKRERQKLISNVHLLFRNTAEPFLKKIQFEEKKINYLITLQRWKYRKELTEIIKFWQYLIQEQLNPGQGQRGYFRQYGPDEKKLMTNYLAPDQLNLVEQQLATEYDNKADEKLESVDTFIMDLVAGLFELFQQDEKIRLEFEEHEKGKKIQSSFQNKEKSGSELDSDLFAPLIKRRLAQIEEEKKAAEEEAKTENDETEEAAEAAETEETVERKEKSDDSEMDEYIDFG